MYNIVQTKGWLFNKYEVALTDVGVVATFGNVYTAMAYATTLKHLSNKK